MKLIRKVHPKEVKRSYVIAQLAKDGFGHTKDRTRLSRAEQQKRFVSAKRKGVGLTLAQLDAIMGKEWQGKRLVAYDSCDWYIGTVHPSEVGVWNRAGGLPVRWTNGSLKETAEKVKRGLAAGKLTHTRAGKVVSNMLKINVDNLQKEKYLYPIIFEGNTGTRGRRSLKRQMKGDIEDGCMRSIALTINGAKTITAYIGIPKK